MNIMYYTFLYNSDELNISIVSITASDINPPNRGCAVFIFLNIDQSNKRTTGNRRLKLGAVLFIFFAIAVRKDKK